MHDFYRLLGIARDASAQVVRFAFEGKLKALADPAYTASPAEKREEERLLREALVTLTVAAKREAYDAKLAAFEEGGGANASRRRSLALPAVLAAFVAVAALAWWKERADVRERVRIEEARAAAQAERDRLAAEREAKRQEELQALQERREEAMALSRERNERLRVQRERADYDRQRRYEEMRVRQAESARESRERRTALEERRAEEIARRAEEESRRAALRELERQKEYLRRQELEEERVRAARHAQAQREAQEREYRRLLEERERRR